MAFLGSGPSSAVGEVREAGPRSQDRRWVQTWVLLRSEGMGSLQAPSLGWRGLQGRGLRRGVAEPGQAGWVALSWVQATLWLWWREGGASLGFLVRPGPQARSLKAVWGFHGYVQSCGE